MDPGDLELRDLLGMSPDVAASWDEAGRARVRAIIAHAARTASAETDAADAVRLAQAGEREAIVAAMLAVDEQRRARGHEPVILGWVLAEQQQIEVLSVAGEAVDMAASGEPSAVVFEGWDTAANADWADLALRRPDLIAGLVRQAGHRDEPRPLPVIPAPQAPFALIVVDAGASSFAAVNPVLLAAQEPAEGDSEAVAQDGARGRGARARSRDGRRGGGAREPGIATGPAIVLASAGNPYSFYGSVNECAAFQRRRCEECAAAGACDAVTREGESGLAECQTLSADERNFYLLCINLALAISTVSSCADDATQCPQAPSAGNQLAALALNSVFLDDTTCAAALDACLNDLFGEPDGDYPGPGQPEPPPPPRDVSPSCGDSSANCEFAPSCDASCSIGSCDNAVSCGSCEGGGCQGCESSGCESGCGDCESSGGGGGGGSSGCDDGGGDGGCGGSGCDGGCDGCDSNGEGGGGGSSSCEGGGCEGGGCDGGGCSSGCEGGDCSSGGSGSCGSSCSVTRRRGQGQTALAVLWLLAPCVFLEVRRRRERRRGRFSGRARPSIDDAGVHPADDSFEQGGRA